MLGVLVLTAVVSTRWVRLNLSRVCPEGVYRLAAVPAEVARGTLVVLPVPASVRHVWPRWVPLLKPVAGVPGDVVCRRGGRAEVNGTAYGPVYLEAHGSPLPHLDPDASRCPQAWCSSPVRHRKVSMAATLGMTPVARLTAAATPLLTWRYR